MLSANESTCRCRDGPSWDTFLLWVQGLYIFQSVSANAGMYKQMKIQWRRDKPGMGLEAHFMN